MSQPSASDLKKLTKPEDGLVLIINPRKRPAEYEQVYPTSSRIALPTTYLPLFTTTYSLLTTYHLLQVYLLEDNPHPEWEGGLLFRAYPDDWAYTIRGSNPNPTPNPDPNPDQQTANKSSQLEP